MSNVGKRVTNVPIASALGARVASLVGVESMRDPAQLLSLEQNKIVKWVQQRSGIIFLGPYFWFRYGGPPHDRIENGRVAYDHATGIVYHLGKGFDFATGELVWTFTAPSLDAVFQVKPSFFGGRVVRYGASGFSRLSSVAADDTFNWTVTLLGFGGYVQHFEVTNDNEVIVCDWWDGVDTRHLLTKYDNTGSIAWQPTWVEPVSGRRILGVATDVCVSGGVAYVSGFFYAQFVSLSDWFAGILKIDIATGAILGHANPVEGTPGQFVATSVACDGVALAVGLTSFLDPGHPAYRDIPNHGSAPALSIGRGLYSLDPSTLATLWSDPTLDVRGVAVADGGRIHAALGQPTFRRYSPTGAVEWEYDAGSAGVSAAVSPTGQIWISVDPGSTGADYREHPRTS